MSQTLMIDPKVVELCSNGIPHLIAPVYRCQKSGKFLRWVVHEMEAAMNSALGVKDIMRYNGQTAEEINEKYRCCPYCRLIDGRSDGRTGRC